ncbi:matrixin family metalloprotease [Labilithrix luteola]|nr:matrixin family metalloprotease [Labilithrix luteola]
MRVRSLFGSIIPVGIIAAFALASAGCMYDSSRTIAKQTQQHNAAHYTPATLQAEGPAPEERASTPPSRPKTMRVRALVSKAFTAHVIDTPKYMRDLFDDANKMTEPSLGIHLELEATRPWDAAPDEDTAKAITSLETSEPGKDVDFVAGFIGALPRMTQSFHEIGRGAVVGKHLVVRAPGSAETHDAVERSFNQLTDDERRKLRKDIARHRAAVVFLHELGHTLGCIHETEPTSIMVPEYNRRVTTFGPEARTLMRATLEKRRNGASDDEVLKAVGDFLRTAPPAAFVADDRNRLLSDIDARATAQQPRTQVQTEAAPAPAALETPGLSPADREKFLQANEAYSKAEMVRAWNTAKPLFEAYRNSFEVQDLRCKIATNSMPFDMARRECDRLMKLATGKAR